MLLAVVRADATEQVATAPFRTALLVDYVTQAFSAVGKPPFHPAWEDQGVTQANPRDEVLSLPGEHVFLRWDDKSQIAISAITGLLNRAYQPLAARGMNYVAVGSRVVSVGS